MNLRASSFYFIYPLLLSFTRTFMSEFVLAIDILTRFIESSVNCNDVLCIRRVNYDTGTY